MSQAHMLIEEFLLHARFERSAKGVLADEFEVLSDVVHLLPF